MQADWPDIPGVTAVDGRARLPRRPAVAVRALAAAIETDGIGLVELVDRVARSTGADRSRLEGLAGWLPVSRVAAWSEAGTLALDPNTDLGDLAVRYAAWVGTQPCPVDHVDQVRDYTKAVVDLAAAMVKENGIQRPGGDGLPSEAKAVVAAEDASPVLDPVLTAKVRAIIADLDASFLERRQHTRASLLALLAGQHVLLLGPPGTAKSLLARSLCGAFEDARYFEYLLSRFTHPDELFGPVSIPGLKEEDYRRLTEGFLPQAHVAFLDEIFKANSAILNSLLTLINERVFHHGRHRDGVPLLGLVGASNELPDPEGGLGALFDRFLVRLAVPPLATPDAFLAVATGLVASPRVTEPLSLEERETIKAAGAQVTVPDEVAESLVSLWKQGARHEWEISDRRWRQAIEMLKVGAAADGRRQLIMLDLLLLEPVLAPDPSRAMELREALLEQLGTGAVPEHDLRAQWMLLRMDRVAPLPGEPVTPPPRRNTPWKERLRIRQDSAARFVQHHQRSVQRLALDRASIEDIGEAHTWLASLPAQVLATHIEAARDLAGILKTAERYRASLKTPASAAGALVQSLPRTSRRMYGHGAVVAFELDGVATGVTLAGEREELPKKRGDLKTAGGLVMPTESGDLPVLRFEPTEFLDWVDGAVPTETVLERVPAWCRRNVSTALGSVRRLLGNSAVPNPPDLPQP